MDWVLLSFLQEYLLCLLTEHWEKSWNFNHPLCPFRDYLLILVSYFRSLRPNHSGECELFITAKEMDELSFTYREIFVLY